VGGRLKVFGIINFSRIAATQDIFLLFLDNRDFAGVVKATAKCVSLCDEHLGNPDLERVIDNI
jgi:hypothetical protein